MANYFRLIGDFIRIIAVIALPIKICKSKTCTGISGKTQILYAIVCSTRYLDLFLVYISLYNSVMKISLILLAYLTVYLIYGKFKETYSRNEDSFKSKYLICISTLLALMFNWSYPHGTITYPISIDGSMTANRALVEVFWAFSIFLEAVAIIPQLTMVYKDKTEGTSSFVFYYIFAMGSYRGFYLMNWIYRYRHEYHYDVIADSAGAVQFLIYCVFAFIYILRKPLYSKVFETPIEVNT